MFGNSQRSARGAARPRLKIVDPCKKAKRAHLEEDER